MSDSDDDMPQLSAQALAALQEFYAEQQETDENEQKEDWVRYIQAIIYYVKCRQTFIQ